MAKQQRHLNVNLLHAGFYASAWRLAERDPSAFVKPDHYPRAAKIAERRNFDAVFLADAPSLARRPDPRPFLSLEPTITLALIAAATERIGLIANASTTYNDPPLSTLADARDAPAIIEAAERSIADAGAVEMVRYEG